VAASYAEPGNQSWLPSTTHPQPSWDECETERHGNGAEKKEPWKAQTDVARPGRLTRLIRTGRVQLGLLSRHADSRRVIRDANP